MAQREFASMTMSGKRHRGVNHEDVESGNSLFGTPQYKDHVSEKSSRESSPSQEREPSSALESLAVSSSSVSHSHSLSSSQTQHSQTVKALAAVFYGISSILVIFTNKAVMTNFHFHYFDVLATLQFLVTTTILLLLVALRKIEIPPLSLSVCQEILPVSLMFLGNVLCGLGSTKSLNIPMFTALRRFSIFLTMLGEWFLLRNKPSSPIVLSVAMMVGGSLIAAAYDLSFDAQGYSLVFLNNVFTALNGVYMKKAAVSGKCSKTGVLFYNSLFSAVIMICYFLAEHCYYASLSSSSAAATAAGESVWMSRETRDATEQVALNALALATRSSANTPANTLSLSPSSSPSLSVDTTTLSTLSKVWAFGGWRNPAFLTMFLGAASMGSVLNYSIFLCTTVNSPLTTAVVGATKNVATTYIGMLVFSDYAFSWVNFLGINVSILGSLYYTYMILFKGASGFGGA